MRKNQNKIRKIQAKLTYHHPKPKIAAKIRMMKKKTDKNNIMSPPYDPYEYCGIICKNIYTMQVKNDN
jgi:hypothetical protein